MKNKSLKWWMKYYLIGFINNLKESVGIETEVEVKPKVKIHHTVYPEGYQNKTERERFNMLRNEQLIQRMDNERKEKSTLRVA